MVAKSLTPEIALRPAQTGQPVLLCNKELTTLQTGALNSCLQSGQTNHAILLLPADILPGEQAFLSLHMVAGILTDGKGTPRISKELVQNFERKCGATICKDLKGIETGKVLCPCPECVRNAVLSLGEALGE